MTKEKDIIARKDNYRKCISCQQSIPKRDMIRIVRAADGRVVVDKTHRLNGRGAYLMNDKHCLEDQKLRSKLSNALKIKITSEDFERLICEIKGE